MPLWMLIAALAGAAEPTNPTARHLELFREARDAETALRFDEAVQAWTGLQDVRRRARTEDRAALRDEVRALYAREAVAPAVENGTWASGTFEPQSTATGNFYADTLELDYQVTTSQGSVTVHLEGASYGMSAP